MAEALPPSVIPWWKSRGVVWALSGVLLALVDGAVSLATVGDVSWRTAVVLVGGALAAWFRANARGFVRAILTGAPPEEPPPGSGGGAS